MVLARGQYVFLQVGVTVGSSLQPPDAGPTPPDAFSFIDVRQILDPDGNDVTAAWVTNNLDPLGGPGGLPDTYGTGSSQYVGGRSYRAVSDATLVSGQSYFDSASAAFGVADVGKKVIGAGLQANTVIQSIVSATRVNISLPVTANGTNVPVSIGTVNVGLFHDGAGSVAQKIVVPVSAEITTSSPGRLWRIVWKLRKSGLIVGSADGTNIETFNVADVGVLVFSTGSITVGQVRVGIDTVLTDAEVQACISEAAGWVLGWISARGFPTTWSSVPQNVLGSTLVATRATIFGRDASAYRKASNLREGDTVVSYSGNSTKDLQYMWEQAEDLLNMEYGLKPGFKKPSFAVNRHGHSRISTQIRAEGRLPFEGP